MTIELDDLQQFNDQIVDAIMLNTRRYLNMFSDVVADLLPTFKERTVVAKDSLDVYIEHRLLMEARLRNQNEPPNSSMNQFPKELMKRL